MLDSFKRLVVDKDEIVSEETKTVKMLVPMSFELVDGKCANEADQELYDFLAARDDVDSEDGESAGSLDNIKLDLGADAFGENQ